MGIKSINEILRKRVPSAFQSILLLNLYGYRVGIDGNHYIHTITATAHRNYVLAMKDPLSEIERSIIIQEALRTLLRFVCTLAEYGITTVWSWDGEAPKEKAECRAERKAVRDKREVKLAELRAEIEAKDDLLRTNHDYEPYKKLLAQHNQLGKEELDYYRSFVEAMGIPSVQAPSEGEKWLANAAREGLLVGVWSEDTDNYPLGTPMMITGFDGLDEEKRPLVKVVFLTHILVGLNLTQAKLVELCILLGCDFNKNMYNVGPVKCWDLLEKYENIDQLAAAEPNRPVHVLKHVRCRELFAPQATGLTHASKELNFDRSKFAVQSRAAIASFGLSDQYDQLVIAAKYIPGEPKQVTFVAEGTYIPPASEVAPAPEALPVPTDLPPPLTAVVKPVKKSRLVAVTG